MRYTIEVMPGPAKLITKLARADQRRVIETIEALADDPRPPGVKKLSNTPDGWRIRVGVYRILYRIKDDRLLVTVMKVGHRGEVYR